MANEYAVNQADLTAVANAIRTKGGTNAQLEFPSDFISAVQAIQAGGGSGLAYDMGEFTLAEDVNSNTLGGTSGLNPLPDGIPHNLGEVPDFILVWTDHWAGITEAPYTTSTMLGFLWMNGLAGLPQRATSAINAINPVIIVFQISGNAANMSVGAPTSAAYGLAEGRLPDAYAFRTPTYGTNVHWRGGVTYHYFVSGAWWNVGGVADAV